jgi:hypothetical protein
MRLAQIVEDKADGELSALRVAMLLWVVGVLVAWIVVSMMHRALQDLPGQVVTVIGVLVTGKTVQRFSERDTVPHSMSTTTTKVVGPPGAGPARSPALTGWGRGASMGRSTTSASPPLPPAPVQAQVDAAP